ncbi:MAG: MFS transporter [Syntrophomonas sp.]
MQKLLSRFYYGWVIALVGFIVITIIYGNKFCFGTLFGPLLDEFGWSRAMVTSVFSLSILSQAFLQPFGGALLDRFGPKKMILAGALLMAVSLTIFGQARSLFAVYLSYGVLFSLAAVGAGMVVNTTMVSRWFVRKRGLAAGLVSVGTGFGLFVFNPLLAYLIEAFGWRNAVTGLGVVTGLIVIVLVGVLVKNDPRDVGQYVDGMKAGEAEQIKSAKTTANEVSMGHGRDWAFRDAMQTREFWLLLLGYLGYLFTWYSITNHAVMAMCDMGLNRIKAATLFGYTGLIAAGSGVAWAWMADKVRDRRIMLIISYSLFCAGCLLFAFNPGGVQMIFLVVLVIGMAHGAAMTLSAVVADRFGITAMGKIWGTITMAGLLGGAIGPILVARLYDPVISYSLAWKVLAFVALMSVCCAVFVRPIPRRFFFLNRNGNPK